jgi:MinD-like ATPase involved in chromosome partitioning or flagellar assembly
VSTDNDAPQLFGDGTGADGFFGEGWPDSTGAADPASATRRDEAAEADPYRPWPGWGAAGDPQPPAPSEGGAYPAGYGYPAPAEPGYPEPGYPAEPEDPLEAGYPSFGYQPGAEYPSGPGYAPLPADGPDVGELGYPAGPGYRSDPDYAHEQGYPADGWVVPGPRLAGDLGYPQAGYRPEASQPMARPSPGWMPPAGLDPPGSARRPDSLSAESLHGKRPASVPGWRRRVFRMTGGLLRLSESAADIRRRDLINRVRTPVAGGHHRVAVLSLKGGVGKTTTTVGLGATLATLRSDRIVAVDANPDRGTLSDKVRLETAATIRDLLNERDQIRRYADIRAFTTQAPSRVEVLASDRDPAVSVAFSAEDYCDAALVLEHFYSICLTDCGTGLLHSAMSGVLGLADQIVVASSPSVDGARSASATLDWLEAHGYGDLVSNGIVVLSAIRPKSKSTVDLDRLEQHFAARCRAVARIPYDPHLEEGAEVELELLTAETADAYLTLAALVGDGLAWPRRLTSRSALP